MDDFQKTTTISAATEDRRQNLQGIRYISAVCSGRITDVLNILTECEKLTLTPDQMDIGKDIVQSINEHGEPSRNVAAYYLIRYGMLLGRKDGANDEQ